jgi:hypothetical protein
MDNIIVYVDDAAYAVQLLQPMVGSDATRDPTRWIVVGCAPRVTHRASKWVTNSARESWRGKWAEKVFSQVLQVLRRDGDIVVTCVAKTALCDQTDALIREYGVARVLDARRPKFGHDLQPVTAAQAQESQSMIGYAAALGGAGLLGATD